MDNIYFYCFLLCIIFLFLNLAHLFIKNKSFFLPSTVFALMWGITTLGCYLASLPHSIFEGSNLIYTKELDNYGYYQFEILFVIFISFIFAHYNTRNIKVDIIKETNKLEISLFIYKFRWILYLLFLWGMMRLIGVISIVGFNINAIREFTLISRASYNIIDLNIIRVGNYLVQFGMLYVGMFGIYSALNGIKLKTLLYNFILFSPFQFSFGGRLYIMSYFVPFLFAYFLIKSFHGESILKDKKNLKKLYIAILIPIILIPLIQSFKTNRDFSDEDNANANIRDLFYSTSIYERLNEQLELIPLEKDRKLGLGRNSAPFLFTSSPDHLSMIEWWVNTKNFASVVVPSMMPDMWFDFGRYGSLIMYFIIFYSLEYYAIKKLSKYSFRNIMIFILICLFMFETVTSSMSRCFRGFFIGLIVLWIFDSTYKKFRNVRFKIGKL